MEEIISNLNNLVIGSLVSALPPEIEPSVKFSIEQAEVVRRTAPLADYERALFVIQSVLDITWEQLNTGHWSAVPLYLRHVYTGASFVKILALLRACAGNESDGARRSEALTLALKAADMGLLLGAPLPAAVGGCLTKAARILAEALAETYDTESDPGTGMDPKTGNNTKTGNDPKIGNDPKTRNERTESRGTDPGGGIRCSRVEGRDIPRLQRPSLEKFRTDHFDPQTPVILTDCMGHWPALTRWADCAYLRRVAGARTVPVELGARYTDRSWGQALMTLTEFIDTHVRCVGGSDVAVGYLAQHPLFDQVPELLSDIREPEYCCISGAADSADEATAINAWFGPAGTVSPLHYDPKHNLLAQVVGSKHVYLYPPSSSPLLYPHDDRLLFNTARVDPEAPDYAAYPRYAGARAWRCTLAPGEMLYIPPRWWHHVRSLETSFSVSFWWE